jgi:hypothetical protein
LTQQTGVDDRAGTVDATALPRLETFSPCVGEPFAVEASAGEDEMALELIEAKALPAQPGLPRARPFVLLFRGPAGIPLGQGMVRLGHPRAGPVELFVVPVAGQDDGQYFEAVFS